MAQSFWIFLTALACALAAASLVWHWLGQPDNWYKACALGLMGGIVGAVGGAVGAFMADLNALAIASAGAAFVGGGLVVRYIDEI